jgi:hypothetical protein
VRYGESEESTGGYEASSRLAIVQPLAATCGETSEETSEDVEKRRSKKEVRSSDELYSRFANANAETKQLMLLGKNPIKNQ